MWLLLMVLFRLCVWLMLLTTVFVTLERLFSRRPHRVFRPQFWVDVGYFFVLSLLSSALLSAPPAVVAWVAHRVVPADLYTAVAAEPLWLSIAATFVIGETGFCWGYRLSHEVPLLWRLHAVHHSAEHMDWLVNTRAHPVDLVFGRLCGLVPLYMVGLAGPAGAGGTAVPALVIVIGTAQGFFIHANLRWRFGWLEWLIATPAFHHWHQTLDGHINRNYAAMLPWLDCIFGTFHLPARQWPAQYGTDTPIGGTLGEQLLHPLLPAGVPQPPARRGPAVNDA